MSKMYKLAAVVAVTLILTVTISLNAYLPQMPKQQGESVLSTDEFRIAMLVLNGMAVMLVGILAYVARRFIAKVDDLEKSIARSEKDLTAINEKLYAVRERVGRIEKEIDS